MNTVVMVGPQGFGKSLMAPQVMREQGCSHVVDEWLDTQPLQPGALHLTCEMPRNLPAGVKVIALAERDDPIQFLSDECQPLRLSEDDPRRLQWQVVHG